MAMSVSKKKPKQPKRELSHENASFCCSCIGKILYRVPTAVFLLFLVFLWSSSTTIISGRIIHVCVSSRKLNNLYCLSAGTQPNFEIPIPVSNSSSLVHDDKNDSDSREVAKFVEKPNSVIQQVSNFFKSNPQEVSNVLKSDSQEVSNIVVENSNPVFKSHSQDVSNVVLEKPNPAVFKNNSEDVSGTNVALENSHPVFKSHSQDVSDVVQENSNPVLRTNSQEVSSVVLENLNPVLKKDAQVSNIINESPNSFFYKTNFAKDRDEEFKGAVKVVEEQLQVHRLWKSTHNHQSCSGKGIYVYDLPPKFNKDLVSQCNDMTPWVDYCQYFINGAMGKPIQKLGKGWYQTHQYSLELMFHSRVLNHPCRVYDQNEAKLFYIPFYGGLDILRWHFKNVSTEVKDTLALELVQWLEMQKPWDKNSGKDHVLVLGKISWDFRRRKGSQWGTKLLELDQMQNPIKVLIERQPWEMNDIGVPHPTHFHPHSDDEITSWQRTIISSYRKSLVSFAGAARPDAPENIRSMLINQCTSTSDENCRFLDCSSSRCNQPESIIELFMESEFCLQPPGDSPTRKSVFDSLISGCIPVIFDPFTAYYQYPWHLPEDHEKYSVFIDQEEVRGGMKVNVIEKLMKVPLKERDDLRRYIVYELMPGLVYGDQDAVFDKFQDAFAITMNNLLERVTKLD